MPRVALLAATALAIVSLPSSRASAGEALIAAGVSSRHSTWRGDWTGGGQLGFGYRFARVFTIDFIGWEEPATVDKRLDTGLTFGLGGTLPLATVRPTLRLYFIHQHEEGFVSVWDHPFGTAFGIGAGIRHRAGGGARGGVEIPFSKEKHTEWSVLANGDVTWFPDNALGPSAYYGVTVGIGMSYALTELP